MVSEYFGETFVAFSKRGRLRFKTPFPSQFRCGGDAALRLARPSFLQNGLPINLNELERIYGSFIHVAGNVGKINSRNETWRYDAADLWRGKYRVCFNWKDFTSCLLIYREIPVIDRPRFSRRRFFSRGRFIIANLISKYLQSEISNERTIRKFANRIFDRFSKNRSTKNPFL